MTGVWSARKGELAEVIEEAKALITRNQLNAMFKWVSREENGVADEVGCKARENKFYVSMWADPALESSAAGENQDL